MSNKGSHTAARCALRQRRRAGMRCGFTCYINNRQEQGQTQKAALFRSELGSPSPTPAQPRGPLSHDLPGVDDGTFQPASTKPNATTLPCPHKQSPPRQRGKKALLAAARCITTMICVFCGERTCELCAFRAAVCGQLK